MSSTNYSLAVDEFDEDQDLTLEIYPKLNLIVNAQVKNSFEPEQNVIRFGGRITISF